MSEKAKLILFLIMNLVYLFVCIFFLKKIIVPYAYIFGLGSALYFSGAIWITNRKIRIILVNISFVCFALAIAELALFLNRPQEAEVNCTRFEDKLTYLGSTVTGYALEPNQRHKTKKYYDEKLLYDVRYTINSHGFRITPEASSSAAESIIFIGGSYTFGEGVNDHDSLPYRVGNRLKNSYQTYNFGLPGFGTHQIYALIENLCLQKVVKKPAAYVIYQSLYPEHVIRILGRESWSAHTPHYVLDSQNIPVRHGYWDNASKYSAKAKKYLARSMLFYRFMHREISFKAKRLFVSLVVNSLKKLQIYYPDIEMHIINWWIPFDDFIVKAFRENNIHVHYAKDILGQDELNFVIAEVELHPNAEAYRIIAEYIVSHIVKQKPNQGSDELPADHL